MTGSALAVIEEIRQESRAALARGDNAAANEAYSRELAARGSVTNAPRVPTVAPRSGVTAYTAGETANAFTVMSKWKGWHTADPDALRRRWGSDAGANLAIATDFAGENGDVVDVLRHAGLNTHPAVVEACAMLGRRYTVQAGDPIRTATAASPAAASPTGASMSNDAKAIIADRTKMTSFIERIDAAKRQGDSRLAGAIYREQLDYIAARDGNREIVNGRRTS